MKLGFQSASSMQYQNLHMEVGNCPSLDYSDLSRDAWYHQCVDYALENDLMTGMGGGIFSPNGTLTRAEAVTVLWKLENRPQVSYQLNFDDVAEGEWFTEMVRWAVSKKIMAGNGDGTINPTGKTKRCEFASMIMKFNENIAAG